MSAPTRLERARDKVEQAKADLQTAMVEAQEAGTPITQIAEQVRMTRSTVYAWINSAETKENP